MRRQSAVGGSLPVQSRAYVRIECPRGPRGWPVAFRQDDEGTDTGYREIELHPDHIVLRRCVAGIAMKLNLRLATFEGVAVRLLDEEGEGVALVLAHADPSLSVTLYTAPDADEVVAHWRAWAAVLGLPMLVTRLDGSTDVAYPMIGRLVVARAVQRRRRRGALKHRRPSIFMRRTAGRPAKTGTVYRGEREISARD